MAPLRPGIWRYAAHYDPVLPPAAWLTLGEGATPAVEMPALAAKVGLDRLVLKREDLNPTGSHKARGVAFQVAAIRCLQPEVRCIAISSSGNAAIAAAAYAAAAGLSLAAFVAPATLKVKVARLTRLGARVFVSAHALTLAQALADRHGIPNLRPSTDPLAVEGFQSIGWELVETVAGVDEVARSADVAPVEAMIQMDAKVPIGAATPIDAVFTFVSSSTSFVALGRALDRSAGVVGRAWMPGLHAVQGTGAHPVAGSFDPRPASGDRGRLGDLGARKTRRAGEAMRWIVRSGGGGWVVTDAEADAAQALLLDHGIETSLEGAAALAAAARAAAAGRARSAVVILTGQPVAEADPSDVDGDARHAVEDLAAVERVLGL